jgi:hypothetical protein
MLMHRNFYVGLCDAKTKHKKIESDKSFKSQKQDMFCIVLFMSPSRHGQLLILIPLGFCHQKFSRPPRCGQQISPFGLEEVEPHSGNQVTHTHN